MINEPKTNKIQIRVRYPEVDQMGVVHHSNYFVYFEMARVEHLRSLGYNYSDCEKDGILFAVVKIACNYKFPAYYDELIDIETTVTRVRAATIEHAYKVTKNNGKTLIAEASSTIACINKDGELQEMPEFLLGPMKAE
ncbi:MAG: acyl-CoA thioesterase [Candidatus Ancaeobacter aquaticus]|nr:acyl-CoA thioesterase [Candidatus Ancaeobacter aquaticus]